jgi:hypothetical protein
VIHAGPEPPVETQGPREGEPAARRRAPKSGLVEYLAEFGLRLADLTPGQLRMFLAARNLGEELVGLEIEVGSQASPQPPGALLEVRTERTLEQTAFGEGWIDSRLPADEMDVQQLQSVEDLPRIFPTQWLLEELNPDLFYARLAQGELLVPVWQRPGRSPRDGQGEVDDTDLVDQQAKVEESKLHAYVLLDTSRTMNHHDRRGTVARGLALAFLLKGHHQRARLHLRPFAEQVGELSSGTGPNELTAIARRIIELPNAGQTRIQTALQQAVRDIRAGGPFLGAAVMLVTDGISRLGQNPLAEERLHTFLVGDLLDDEQESTVATLRAWSRSFHRIWPNRFGQWIIPSVEDCRQVLEALQQAAQAAPADEAARLLASARALIEDLRRSLPRKEIIPPEIRQLQQSLRQAEADLPEAVGRALAEENAGRQARGGSGRGNQWGTGKSRWLEILQRALRWLGRLVGSGGRR